MDIHELKQLLAQANQDAENAFEEYSKKSSAHRAALKIMKIEKELHYGDVTQSQHLKKIKDIITFHAEEIINENNKA
ncbi:CxC ATPase DNA modification system associated small protein [Pseudoalteromonas sp. G4]|uniref:CxC ATPase DNA modification system associated small protein n=1 Tax=Pseudoalteromonas sp. G4 TaxID=2992761 RepID=UPI00237EAAC9|nr:CxC ATPase DNA modification system associated small protein [Pseudoalteromonas sp. G4]MDE3271795.1 hypothetical protein [Pseudoalteromonas sp. G4]